MKPTLTHHPNPRRANLRVALTLGAFALLCYFGIYAFYVIRP